MEKRAFSRIEEAEDILLSENPSIVHYPAPGSCGGVNDYYSEGTYWHPDPSKPDGLPYIRRDGVLNTSNFVFHKDLLVKMKHNLAVLYRAYISSGESRYLNKLESMLDSFFIDRETRINPSLNYSQAIAGICSGRSIGVIDFLQLIDIPVMVRDLNSRGVLKTFVYEGMVRWCNAYSIWLETSDFGFLESRAENNHSITYYAQLASFSLFRSDRECIRRSVSEQFKTRLLLQLDADGSMSLELLRSRPYSYSIFALDNLVTIAEIISTGEDDLFNFETGDQRSLKKAVYFISQYMRDKGRWPYARDIENFDRLPLNSSFLYFAGKRYRDSGLLELYRSLPSAMDMPLELERHVAVYLPEVF